MPQIVMKLNADEKAEMLAKAEKLKLSMSDYLRKRIGYPLLHRGVGRPARKVTCEVCGALVSVSRYSRHMRLNHA